MASPAEASSPPGGPSASKRAVFGLNLKQERGKSPLMSSAGGPTAQQRQQQNNVGIKTTAVRFCCFDPKDALAPERTREEHLTELAHQFFEGDVALSTPAPAATGDAAVVDGSEDRAAEAVEMVKLDNKLSRSQLRLSVSNPSTQETV